MNKKIRSVSYIILSAILCMGNAYSNDYPPQFAGKFIKVVAAKKKCGTFTIQQKTNDNVYLYAYANINGVSYWLKNFFKPGKVDYDWAGSGPNDHYVIGCGIKTPEGINHRDMNCADYVTITSEQHNVDCKSIKSDKSGYSLSSARKWISDEWKPAAIIMGIAAAIVSVGAAAAILTGNKEKNASENRDINHEPFIEYIAPSGMRKAIFR